MQNKRNSFRLRYRISREILEAANEIDIAFLYGKRTSELPNINKRKKIYTGVWTRIAIFLYYCFKRLSFKKESLKEGCFFFYAGTKNQFVSLESSFLEIEEHERIILCEPEFSSGERYKEELKSVRFSIKDFLISLLLLIENGRKVYKKIVNQDGRRVASLHFDKFCLPYIYIPYFLKILINIDSKMVVQSNDHNAPNRTLCLVAKYLGIKTAYMQHASVSSLFPPLDMDYAFLDGEESLEKYVQCLLRSSDSKASYGTRVYLSGQKKTISRREGKRVFGLGSVGIAINSLDRVSEVVELLDKVSCLGLDVIIRFHPTQSTSFIESVKKNRKKGKGEIEYSYASRENLDSFFTRCFVIIAGNTSLHLEAALAGLETYYYKMGGGGYSDYYGFVKNGVSKTIDRNTDLVAVFLNDLESDGFNRMISIKRYVETYGSKWHGEEGKLVANTLYNLAEDGQETCFRESYSEYSKFFNAIYKPCD